MGVIKATAVLFVSSLAYAYPHFPGHPRFYDEGLQSNQPTVNVFKIYAPRVFYMPGYKPQVGRSESNFLENNKQMINEPTETILDGLIRTEMFPESLFGDDADMMQYNEEFVPEPSSVVSRKLPLYSSFRGPSMMPEMEPSMKMNDYYSARANGRQNFQDEAVQFFPDNLDMHDENCNHMHNFLSTDSGYPISGLYPELATIQILDPLFLNEIAPKSKPMRSMENAAMSVGNDKLFNANPVGPLSSFFKNFISSTDNGNDEIEAQLVTTVSFGAPEIVKRNEVTAANAPAKADPKESRSDGEIDFIITEKLEPTAEHENDGDGEDDDNESSVEEIERNFIKTVLPDRTFVTTEVTSEKKDDSNDRSAEDKNDGVPMKEVEVNIVKTILPDDSYLVSEAGGENEKFQDDVISMIQNSDVTATDRSTGSVFISRYLEAPSAP